MKRWLRKLLGLDDDFKALHARFTDLQDEILGIRSDMSITFGDEHSPQRKAMSDRLGQRAIQRLKAEDMARKLMTGGE